MGRLLKLAVAQWTSIWRFSNLQAVFRVGSEAELFASVSTRLELCIQTMYVPNAHERSNTYTAPKITLCGLIQTKPGKVSNKAW